MKVGDKVETIVAEMPYIIVRNVTSSPAIFGRSSMPGQKAEDTVPVTLRPAEKVALVAEEWQHDMNLRGLVQAGVVKLSKSDAMPDRMPELTAPPDQYLNSIERGAVHDIVFGNATQSASAIGVSQKIGDSRTKVNVSRLKTRNRDVLNAALYWFDLLSDWDPEWDKDMVDVESAAERRGRVVNRIQEIDRMPMRPE